ncbi:response regulator [Pelomonas sp. SE-A7]|uniref:response regulator transcription factor n=1 Tax=Pelomonas sp. SE-A7 TaxID=3054953 RepID=UPI00259C8CC6|nr:response regulator [Pelomonas sp. SE-A7]MDM4765082.1 response regulator [Pelomonas sp. SE-A7]
MTHSVLVVDDSRAARMMICGWLKQELPDWGIYDCGGGDEALALLEGAVFDVISIDFNMPTMDGLTLAEKLREARCTSKLVMYTANIQESIRQRAEWLDVRLVRKMGTRDSVVALAEAIRASLAS